MYVICNMFCFAFPNANPVVYHFIDFFYYSSEYMKNIHKFSKKDLQSHKEIIKHFFIFLLSFSFHLSTSCLSKLLIFVIFPGSLPNFPHVCLTMECGNGPHDLGRDLILWLIGRISSQFLLVIISVFCLFSSVCCLAFYLLWKLGLYLT